MKYYISMGQIHTHSIEGKTIDKDCIVEIEAEGRTAAQEMAYKMFGREYSFVYNERPNMVFFPRGIIQL